MDEVTVFKALANASRLQILQLMRQPERHFGAMPNGQFRDGRVCVGEIQKKLGLCQSTASQYLAQLQQAGLIRAERSCQWTFYVRNEGTLREVEQFMNQKL
ncbi:MAG: helix-turn-helix domain-containing protein [Gammaproteobacteria bacterium]|nr:helix-turn-helix domain-containing protein [Gammaproteobacteria bacterium]